MTAFDKAWGVVKDESPTTGGDPMSNVDCAYCGTSILKPLPEQRSCRKCKAILELYGG